MFINEMESSYSKTSPSEEWSSAELNHMKRSKRPTALGLTFVGLVTIAWLQKACESPTPATSAEIQGNPMENGLGPERSNSTTEKTLKLPTPHDLLKIMVDIEDWKLPPVVEADVEEERMAWWSANDTLQLVTPQ